MVQQFVQKCQYYYTLSDQSVPPVTVRSNISLLTEQLTERYVKLSLINVVIIFNYKLMVGMNFKHYRFTILKNNGSCEKKSVIFFPFFSFSDQRHGNSTVFDHPIIGFDDPQNGRNNKPLEKETNLSTQEQKGPVSSNSEISSSSSKSSNSNNQKSKQEEQTKLTQKVPHAPQQFHKRLEIT